MFGLMARCLPFEGEWQCSKVLFALHISRAQVAIFLDSSWKSIEVQSFLQVSYLNRLCWLRFFVTLAPHPNFHHCFGPHVWIHRRSKHGQAICSLPTSLLAKIKAELYSLNFGDRILRRAYVGRPPQTRDCMQHDQYFRHTFCQLHLCKYRSYEPSIRQLCKRKLCVYISDPAELTPDFWFSVTLLRQSNEQTNRTRLEHCEEQRSSLDEAVSLNLV